MGCEDAVAAVEMTCVGGWGCGGGESSNETQPASDADM